MRNRQNFYSLRPILIVIARKGTQNSKILLFITKIIQEIFWDGEMKMYLKYHTESL